MSLDILPDDILYRILLVSKFNEIKTYCRLFQRFQDICYRETFWQDKIYRDFGIEDIGKNYTFRDLYNRLYQGKSIIVSITYKGNIIVPNFLIDEDDTIVSIFVYLRDNIVPNRKYALSYEFITIYKEKKVYDIGKMHNWSYGKISQFLDWPMKQLQYWGKLSQINVKDSPFEANDPFFVEFPIF